ncbi:MAG: caspase domain-containing protein [Elusimicrobiota bacterium]
MGLALLPACSSIPVAPALEPLPPAMSTVRLWVNSVDSENDVQKVTEGGSIDAELLPAVASALKSAGFRLVFDPASADAAVGLTATSGPTNSSPYHTTLILTTPQGAPVDHVFYKGGAIGVPWSGAPEYVARLNKQIASGIALNLVDELMKSTTFQAFAEERGQGRPGSVSSDADRPPYRRSEVPGAFAVVVGVEKYSHDLPAARFAERDAQAVKNHLIALGYPERNIKLLTGSRAVRSALAAYLEDWLPRNVKEDGKVLFYFAGHGAPDPGTGRAYLMPWDGDPNYLDKTAYPVGKLYAQLNALKADKILVVLDSGFSGAGGRSVLAKGARPLVSQTDGAATPGGKLVLLEAASSNEGASALEDQGHGLFTYYFLKGLGAEAKDGSGTITPRGLYDFLKPKVQDAAGRQNRAQTPVLSGPANGAL